MPGFYQYNNDVSVNFNLSLLPLYRIKGEKWPQLPGLFTFFPPRKSARGREEDRLVVLLTFSGNNPLTTAEYNQMASRMAAGFYHTPGSVTSAVRASVENLNQTLVDRNLRTTGKGQYVIGRLIACVLRGTQLVCAQCGPTHAFHLTRTEAQHIHDPQIAGRGLGIGQATPLHLAQVDLHHDDLLVLCADLPSGWEAAMRSKPAPAPEALNRELLSITNDDLNAVLVQVQAGKGELTILKAVPGVWRSTGQTARAVARTEQASAATPPAETGASRSSSRVQSSRPASRFARLLAGVETESSPAALLAAGIFPQSSAPTPSPAEVPAEKPARQPEKKPPPASQKTVAPLPAPTPRASSAAAPRPPAARFISPRSGGELPEIKRPSGAGRQGLFRGVARLLRGTRLGVNKAAQKVGKFLPNLLPGQKDGEPTSGGPSLAFLAVAVPLVIVTIAGLVYTRYGRSTQYEEFFYKAVEQASLAHGQTNPTDVRHAWDSTLYYLDQADNYQISQESLNLRQEAQTALDNLDGIVRLHFSPAIAGGLDRTVQVSRMAATSNDLYLLDASRGSVIRATLGSQVYEVDANFTCGPGTYAGVSVGRLIDIEALQMSNDFNARLIAIDAAGNLVYCGFNLQPRVIPLSTPPLGWQDISGFSLDADGRNLYVLDPPGNTVWVYQGASGKFPDAPRIFFGEQVPQDMGTVIDLAASSSELYLLFADGHVAVCPVRRFVEVPMRCSDPATFVDNRPERQPGPGITDAVFSQMTFAPAPDPSLYMLEPLTRAVYYFSPRSDSLELRGQLRSSVEQSNSLFDGPATAVIFSPNRYVFLAAGHQVFFASSVP